MKKTLYGTTAIVALGLAIVAAAPASAQAPAQGFSSTNFQFTVGGLARGFVGGLSQDDILSHATAPTITNGVVSGGPAASNVLTTGGGHAGVDVQRDYRLDLTARATLPNGMVASAVVQIQPNSGSYASPGTGIESQFRRNWVALASSFGQIQIGALDNVAFQMAQGAMDAFTAGSARTGKLYDFAIMPNAFGRDDTGLGASNNIRLYDRSSDKIAFFSPRIEGFQVGLNYTPEASKDRNSGLPSGVNGVYQKGWAAAANYINTFSGVSVRGSGSYVKWNAPKNGAGATAPDASAWGFGGGLAYMGFDIGGAYGSYNDVMQVQTANPLRLDAGGAVAAAGVYGANRFIGDGRGFDLGLGYTMGPARMSLNYFNGEMKANAIAATTGVITPGTGKDKLQTYALNGAYTMGPGVNLEASLFHIRATAPYTNANVTNTQKATGLITGLILSF